MNIFSVYLTEPKHYLYKEWLEEPPENMEVVEREFEMTGLSSVSPTQFLAYIRDKARNNINSHIVFAEEEYDLIHSNGSIIYNPDKPWIVDFEDGTAFTFLQTPTEEEQRKVAAELRSEKCRRLMPHCEAAKQSFYSIYEPTEKIKEKTEVVYPGLKAPENYDIDTDKFSILFVAREFERKGGYEAYRAFKELRQEFDNLEFICVSDTPEEVKDEDIENTRFYEDVPREDLYDLYREADLFVYPTFHDTFGIVMIEAMAFGNPVITLDAFATNEIVDDGRDGYIIEGYDEKWFDPETKVRIDQFNDWRTLREKHREDEKNRIVKDIVSIAYEIISNDEKYQELSKNAIEKIESGKFSVETRNKKLSRIYESSLNL